MFLLSTLRFHLQTRTKDAVAPWPMWLAVVLLMAGCVNTPTAPPVAAPPQATLQELILRAETSAKEGRKESSRLQYRDAAKAYPTSALPWSRLAEDYFESKDHGNAILAAQEVVLREPQNVLAQSVLAVSGLRVSSVALTSLRAQQSGVPIGTREQAAELTKTLREALGETVLVPRFSNSATADSTPSSTGAAPAGVAVQPSARPKPAAAPAKPATKTAQPKPEAVDKKPAAPKSAAPATSSSNPFDILK